MQYEMNQETIETIGDNASIIFGILKYMDNSGWFYSTEESILLADELIGSIETILYSIRPLYKADTEKIKEYLWKLLMKQLSN